MAALRTLAAALLLLRMAQVHGPLRHRKVRPRRTGQNWAARLLTTRERLTRA